MRFEGRLTAWNDDRGFGYLESTQGGEPIFVHVSAWPKGKGRPQLGQQVSFEIELGQKGKRAKSIQFVRVRTARRASGLQGRAQWGTATLFAIPAFVLMYFAVAILWRPPVWITGLYLVASVVTFCAYAMDKAAAATGSRRTRENTLHTLSLVGGWPGALVAQQFLRHKSSKPQFRQVFWFTVALNVVAFVALASQLGRRAASAT